jgi:hypothetical protein
VRNKVDLIAGPEKVPKSVIPFPQADPKVHINANQVSKFSIFICPRKILEAQIVSHEQRLQSWEKSYV